MAAHTDAPQTVPKSIEENRQVLGLQLFVALLVCAIGLYVFGSLLHSIINSGNLVQFDQNLELAVHSAANAPTTQLFQLISMLGFEGLWVVVITVGLYYLIKRKWSHFIMWVAGFAGAQILNAIIKLIIARPRPVFEDPLAVAANYSFPSGHAMMSLVMYGLLAVFIMLNTQSVLARVLITLITIMLVLLIGYSRLYLGVHYFSDIAAGYAVGVIWLTLCITAMDLFKQRHQAMIQRSTANR